MFNTLKRIIPEKIKQKIALLFVDSNDPRWSQYFSTHTKKIFIFLSGFYQNMGDMAITYAQKEFIRSVFPHAEIICVPSTQTYSSIKTIKKYIREEDIITINGGGNMDELYPSLENARQYVIQSFPKNKIISFPQTIHYTESKKGIKWVRSCRKIYKSHPYLTIFAREQNSYNIMKNSFPETRIGLCPDIVMSLNKERKGIARNKVMCCFRNDLEQNISIQKRKVIIERVRTEWQNVILKDTVDLPIESCLEEKYSDTLEAFWKEINSCRLVITDRLHCMIFCAITGTPCVALDCSNHKISAVYDTWLTDNDGIRIVNNDPDTIMRVSKELYLGTNSSYHVDLADKFLPLKEALIE